MKLASARLIVADIKKVVGFYEMVTGQAAEWLAPVFAEIVTPAAALAIGSAETVALFREGSAEPCANRSLVLEFQVEDVDAFVSRAVAAGAKITMPVEDMFWGDRYGKLEDPFGHHWSVATHIRDVSAEEMRQAAQKMCG